MLKSLLVTAFAIFLPSAPAIAGNGLDDLSKIVQIDLIKGWQADQGDLVAAIRITMADGWKTYWRVAGETGLPPVVDWQGSGNLAKATFDWPRPHVIRLDGLVILGYKRQLILPVRLTPVDATAPLKARASLDIGVCREVCIPVHVNLSATLDSANGPEKPLIDIALADLPQTALQAKLTAITCQLAPIKGGVHLKARINMPPLKGPDEIVTFETGQPDQWVTPTQTRRDGDTLWAEADVMNFSGKPVSLDPATFRVTVIGQQSAVDIAGCPEAG